MSIGAGSFFAAALLLGGAGVAKLSQPAAVARAIASARIPGGRLLERLPVGRLVGATEIVTSALALAFGTRAVAILIALAYLAFAAMAWRLLTVQASRQPCGCFGETSVPVSPVHVVVDLALAAAGIVAAVSPPGSVLHLARHQPLAGIPFVVATLTLTWLAYLAFTALPALLDARAAVEQRYHGEPS
jgi:hypothetical protein